MQLFIHEVCSEEEPSGPELFTDSTQREEHPGAVRLQDLSSASDPPSDRRRSLLAPPQQMDR